MGFFNIKPQPFFPLKDLLRKASSVPIAFDRLSLGVDNIRYDVRLSPKFCSTASKLAFQSLVLAARAEDRVDAGSKSERTSLRSAFRTSCKDVLFSGIRLAREFKEIQIDFLAQVALHKFLVQEIRNQFDGLCRHFRKAIRETESPRTFNPMESARLKQALSDIVKNRHSILGAVCKDLYRLIGDIQRDLLRKNREAAFGNEALLPESFFENPLIYSDAAQENPHLILESPIFGHRSEDANRYDALIALVKQLLSECDPSFKGVKGGPSEAWDRLADEWISEPENIDRLFNAEETKKQCKELSAHKDSPEALSSLISRAVQQERLLNFFYHRFKERDLISIVSASYEIQPGFQEYCPPLIPQAVLQFVVNRRSRDTILDRLKRLSKTEGRTYAPDNLWKMVRRVRRLKRRQKETYLKRYLKDLSRYHRDLKSASRVREAMDSINLITDEKTINLSRVNNLLYEFLLPEEEKGDHSPIANHVVLKADVRGSTEIILQMKHKGFNPASFFSLNFFEPINRLLETYEAEKVFIEGDAIILSVLERAQPSRNLFTVARACGLAMDILSVVRRCNAGSAKTSLPLIEIGIGIGFQIGPPTYLFDGDRRIMISPAINDAHFLCRSDRRAMITGVPKPPFNLVFFESVEADGRKADASAAPIIYNVNGIALDAAGFRKLSSEIDMRTLECIHPDFAPNRLRLHVGRFPTPAGAKRALVIREAPFSVIGEPIQGAMTDSERVYFEVCTYPSLLAWAEKRLT